MQKSVDCTPPSPYASVFHTGVQSAENRTT